MERGRKGRGKGGERECGIEDFAGDGNLGKGGDRYILDGPTKREIWLLNLTLLPSN